MSRTRPRLRNGVDLQLQSAFGDGNWAVAIRLAEKRARTLQDQYFDIVKICAESQLDDPAAKLTAVEALRRFVKDGVVVKDVDGIDLLEWAVLDLIPDDEYADTLGPLRARAVKASPKDKVAATRCLESCLLHWDLVSAQQIAAMIDRSFPGERMFLFWNIAITHLLATSPQCPPEKQKLYGMLAHKQMERAAQLTEQARTTASSDEPPTPPARSVQTEQEVLLLYDVTEAHGSPQDLEKTLASPVFSPVSQFRIGRKEPFLQVVTKYHSRREWQTVLDLCRECLSDADENDEPTLLASDVLVWRYFIDAAANLRSAVPDAVTQVQQVLLQLAKSKNLRPIYRRNILLARLWASFDLGSGDEPDLTEEKPSSLRLRELIAFIDDQQASAACFDDIKSCVEKLDISAAKYLACQYVPQQADAARDAIAAARLHLLSIKLRFLVSTCPTSIIRIPGEQPASKCLICETAFETTMCTSCLTSISNSALEIQAQTSMELTGDSIADQEILPELALAVALCNLKLAFNADRPGLVPKTSASLRHICRALFILEHQLHLTPKHGAISLLMVQLHLRLGSAHRAREIWDDLAVKRTIIDSLAPIFYDRLSTLSPAVLSPSDSWGQRLTETLKAHYAVSLKLRMPRRLIDAFEAGSYRSIMDMPKYVGDLRASCTRAMGLVEDSRTKRMLGIASSSVLDDVRFTEVFDELRLNEVIDYGSFPSWDCSSCRPVYEHLRIGPPPSNERCHLSLLAEAFHDVLNYKPPSVYKAAAATGPSDQTFVLEMMARIGHSFSKFLRQAGRKCTAAEMLYFESVSLLCTLITICTTSKRASPLPDVLEHIVDSLRAALETLSLALTPSGDDETEQAAALLASLHDVAMLRETAAAVSMTMGWILDYNERAKERDRSGNSNLPKDMVALIKGLRAAAAAELARGRDAIRDLKGHAGVMGRDGVARLRRWALGGDDALAAIVEDGTVFEVVESWRLGVEGWQGVKWE
ncbi:hypothetical protein HIM_00789 [Hirsutella minnesotensis 3608]|nr:hypothetical protein HIM_00789 [Hirsutella minnesotensis 3608]